MSAGNGNAPAAKGKPKTKRPKLVPLLMLGSDGHCYVCCPSKNIPVAILRAPGTIVAMRLTPRERDIALDCLQNEGVVEVAKTLGSVVGGRFDA